MKKSLSPAVAIGIVAIVVIALGFVAFRFLFPNTDQSPTSEAAKKQYEETHANSVITQRMRERSQGGGNQAGGAYQGGTGQQMPNNRGAYGSAGGR